jgi:hypothetical protein
MEQQAREQAFISALTTEQFVPKPPAAPTSGR